MSNEGSGNDVMSFFTLGNVLCDSEVFSGVMRTIHGCFAHGSNERMYDWALE